MDCNFKRDYSMGKMRVCNLTSLQCVVSLQFDVNATSTSLRLDFIISLQKVELAPEQTPKQVFSCEISKIFKDTYFEEHLRTAASGTTAKCLFKFEHSSSFN